MGEDVFVSYSRQDANAYAFALAHALTQRKLACYLDQLGSPPGAEIPEEVLRKAERCQVFVLIATQGAKSSSAIHKEISRFLPTRRALIPVNVDGALQEAAWYAQVRGVAEARETGAVVQEGRPAEALLDRIETAVGYNRRSRRITRAALVTVALVGLVTLAASIFSGTQAAHARKAEREQAVAVRLRDEARAAEKDAVAARVEAIAAKNDADRAAASSRVQAQEAERLATEARKRGQALRLAAAARQQLPFDPKLSVQLAEAAVRASEPSMDEAVAVLRQALADDHEAAVLRRFPLEVSDIAVAPDGRSVAIASGDKTVELVDLAGRRLCPPFKVTWTPRSLALGQELLAAGGTRGLYLWDVRSCKALEVPFEEKGLEKVQLAPDETLFAFTRGGVLHMRTRMEWSQPPLMRAGQTAGAVAISQDGQVAVAASYDGHLRLLRFPGGNPQEWTLPPGEGAPGYLLISPDSRTAALLRGRELLLIDLIASQVLHRLEAPFVGSMAFSADSALLALTIADAPTRILDVASGEELASLGPSIERIEGVAFGPLGTLLATYDPHGVIRLYSASGTGGWAPLMELRGHPMEVQRVIFLPGGRQVLSSGMDGSVRLWNIALPDGSRTQLSLDGRLNGARFLAEKGLLLSWDRDVQLHDIASGQLRAKLVPPVGSSWVGAGISKAALAQGMEAGGSLCDSARERVCLPLIQARGKLLRAAPGPGGMWAGIRDDGRVFTSSGKELGGHDVWNLAFSPLPDLLAMATKSRDGLLWRSRLGGAPSRLVGHSHTIQALAFSPDGQRLITGSTDHTARIWSVSGARPGAELHSDRLLLGHDDGVVAVAFSQDGTQAVTASWDGSVRVWETATGNPIQVLPFREDSPLAVAFLPDGRIASVTNRGVLRVTPCELCGSVPELLEQARRHKAARLTAREVESVAGDVVR
ncbi:TIR domain-containing protein [Pyxidicoccus parkwayensis]|uniref:TIR domain-containing protein n=1 Tax=Pyxidicoccus parkwayensis TaxID=2813578 RepID=A0ABX7NJU8_9BACT|nr:TIR domain-containing protein [Pyxidicoccus parkwaysis]QSQ19140.1 TIR domain-containing protein [Pyxidicoccus parkwaysis]